MDRLSTSAATLTEESRRNQGIPETVGIRILAEDREDGARMRTAYVDNSGSGDRRLEEHGIDFYLAAETIQPLEEVVIEAGQQDPPQLVFRRHQPPT